MVGWADHTTGRYTLSRMTTINTKPSSIRNTVVIIGGGLAGIAAAVALAQRGISVALIEARKKLGGRAMSFIDLPTGLEFDNAQHVLLRCCTNMIDLYKRLGVDNKIQWHDKLFFAGIDSRIDTLKSSILPPPLHLLPSLIMFRNYTLKEKFAIARAMTAALRTGRKNRIAYSEINFMAWLKKHHQPASTIERFWRKLIVSACNEPLETVAARYGLQVLQDGLLADRTSYEIGVSTVPLCHLYETAIPIINQAGANALLGTSAQSLAMQGSRISQVKLNNNQVISGDYFVSTIPFDRLAKLVSPAMVDMDSRLQYLNQFQVSPIIAVHLFIEAEAGNPAMTLPHVMTLDGPLDWVFNKGFVSLSDNISCQYLQVVISAAGNWVDHPSSQIVAMVRQELTRSLPVLARKKLAYSRVIKEKRATFALKTGIDQYRPDTNGEISNLFIAGDWTDTGWPATMEGAVRSGYRAGEMILKSLGRQDAALLVTP